MTRRKKHPGGRRPRDSSGATSPLTVRVTPDQRKRCEAAAGDEPLATWAARALVEVAERGTEPHAHRLETLEDVVRYLDGLDIDDRVEWTSRNAAALLHTRALLAAAVSQAWLAGDGWAIRAACESFEKGER